MYMYIHCKYYIILLYILCIYNKYTYFSMFILKSSTKLKLGYLNPKSEPYLKYMRFRIQPRQDTGTIPFQISLLGSQACRLVWPDLTCTSSVGFLHVPPKAVGG